MIPLYGCLAHGGSIITMDDDDVVTDLADADGDGGNTFTPYLVSTPFDGNNEGGWSRLRRFVQDVQHDGTATIRVAPYRDGQQTAQQIDRSLAIGEDPIVTAPFAATGTRFAVRVTITAFSAKVELGKAQAWLVPRRANR